MLPTLLLTATALLAAPLSPTNALGGGSAVDLVEVHLERPRDRALLQRFASDIDDHHHAIDNAHIFANDAEQALLRRLGLQLEVLQEDLSQYYADRSSTSSLTTAGGSFAGYRTYDEMNLRMVQMAAIYPQIVSQPINVGTTVQGRTIWGMRISSTPNAHDPSKPVVWYDGLHHAREPISGEAVLRFAEYIAGEYSGNSAIRELVQTRNLIFLPIVNPDGYEFNLLLTPSGGGMWRKNLRQNSGGSLGVDLNRNYDWEWGPQWPGSSVNQGDNDYHGTAAFSEPESLALRDFAALQPPVISISCHSYGGFCIFPWGYDTLLTADDGTFRPYAQSFAEPLAWQSGTVWETLGFANGTSIDFQYGTHGTVAMAFEIGTNQDGFWPTGARIDELTEELRPAFLRAARLAGPAPRILSAELSEVSGNGDSWQDPGELWVLRAELENEGLAPSAGLATLLVPSDVIAYAMVPENFVLAARERRTIELAYRIAPGAPLAELRSLRFEMDAEGGSGQVELALPIGPGRLLATDNFDTLDAGWQVHGQGSGAWELAAPQQVFDGQSGELLQPGNDASGTGSCFVTGALAGATVSDNDVDGVTRLVSPRFDASGFEYLRLDFERWFASLPESAPADDVLLVEASSDDGQSWTPVAQVRHANAWIVSRIELSGALSLSEQMRLRFTVKDDPDNGLTEALVDELRIYVLSAEPVLGLWGTSHPGDTPQLSLHAPNFAGKSVLVRRALQEAPGAPGSYQLQGPAPVIWGGALDAQGRVQIPVALQAGLYPLNGSLYFQALVDGGNANATWSNCIRMRVN